MYLRARWRSRGDRAPEAHPRSPHHAHWRRATLRHGLRGVPQLVLRLMSRLDACKHHVGHRADSALDNDVGLIENVGAIDAVIIRGEREPAGGIHGTAGVYVRIELVVAAGKKAVPQPHRGAEAVLEREAGAVDSTFCVVLISGSKELSRGHLNRAAASRWNAAVRKAMVAKVLVADRQIRPRAEFHARDGVDRVPFEKESIAESFGALTHGAQAERHASAWHRTDLGRGALVTVRA